MSDLSKRWLNYCMNYWSGPAYHLKFEPIEYLDKNCFNIQFRRFFLQNLIVVECDVERPTPEPKDCRVDRFPSEANVNWTRVRRSHMHSFRDLKLTDTDVDKYLYVVFFTVEFGHVSMSSFKIFRTQLIGNWYTVARIGNRFGYDSAAWSFVRTAERKISTIFVSSR